MIFKSFRKNTYKNVEEINISYQLRKGARGDLGTFSEIGNVLQGYWTSEKIEFFVLIIFDAPWERLQG